MRRAYGEVRDVDAAGLDVVIEYGLDDGGVHVLGEVGEQLAVGRGQDFVLGADDALRLLQRDGKHGESAIDGAGDVIRVGGSDGIGLRLGCASKSKLKSGGGVEAECRGKERQAGDKHGGGRRCWSEEDEAAGQRQQFEGALEEAATAAWMTMLYGMSGGIRG